MFVHRCLFSCGATSDVLQVYQPRIMWINWPQSVSPLTKWYSLINIWKIGKDFPSSPWEAITSLFRTQWLTDVSPRDNRAWPALSEISIAIYVLGSKQWRAKPLGHRPCGSLIKKSQKKRRFWTKAMIKVLTYSAFFCLTPNTCLVGDLCSNLVLVLLNCIVCVFVIVPNLLRSRVRLVLPLDCACFKKRLTSIFVWIIMAL